MPSELLPVSLTGIELLARGRWERLRAEAREERLARLARSTHAIDSRRMARPVAMQNPVSRRTVQ
jgi:hypothetical protein